MKKKITVNVIIHMVLIILAVICLFPIFLVLINSFKENAEIVRNPLSLPDIIHLENYIGSVRMCIRDRTYGMYSYYCTYLRNTCRLCSCRKKN